VRPWSELLDGLTERAPAAATHQLRRPLLGFSAALIHGARTRRRLRFLPVARLAATVLVTLHSIVEFSLQSSQAALYVAAAVAIAAAVGRDGEAAGERRKLENRAA
jgi:hypothetical protein